MDILISNTMDKRIFNFSSPFANQIDFENCDLISTLINKLRPEYIFFASSSETLGQKETFLYPASPGQLGFSGRGKVFAVPALNLSRDINVINIWIIWDI